MQSSSIVENILKANKRGIMFSVRLNILSCLATVFYMFAAIFSIIRA